ncbi:MAG TPA: glycosyltransferase [Abditibacteriaceae bacterium]|jgi:glycosyltransferase involved in cell wall biosynthesis
MKILHVLEAMGGGTRRHVLDLLPALVQRGVACTLAVSPTRNWQGRATFEADAAWLRTQGVHVEVIEMRRSVAGARAVSELARCLRRLQPDIVHAHSSVAGALARLARIASPRTPLVYTPHCIAFETGLPHIERRVARWAEMLLAPLCSEYIAVSRAEQKAIARVLGRRAVLIPNGIDLEEFDAVAPGCRADWNLSEDDFVIGCFGRLCAQKNQISLLRAFETLAQEVPNAKLLFIGDGEDRAKLEESGRNRPYFPNVIFAGEHAEARGFYALCDVVTQPSRWEGCPYSVLEAMAARKTVVARAVGGIEEILDENCGVASQVLPEFRHSDLVFWLHTAHREARWRKMTGEAARARIESDFTLQQMVEKTLAVYDGICSR